MYFDYKTYRNEVYKIKKTDTWSEKSIEKDGNYDGLFTIDELKLMEYTSTTLPIKDIKKVLKKMDCVVEKKYYFSKWYFGNPNLYKIVFYISSINAWYIIHI